MKKSDEYIPPKKWTWDAENGGQFASINRPIAGETHEKTLPKGEHRFQLYSLATPNGQKATIMFEELLEAGIKDAEYDAWLININEGDQFGSGFVDINPNSKIPALFDEKNGQRVFESGSILVYLAENCDRFLPKDLPARTETLNWLFWQMGSAPYLGGGFGHFFAYAPWKMEYPINRFTMEVKRQLDVLDRHLADSEFIVGSELSIADIAIWPWYGACVLDRGYPDAFEFLDAGSYKNLTRWARMLDERPAFKRGRVVNRSWGEEKQQLHERHSSTDFDNIEL